MKKVFSRQAGKQALTPIPSDTQRGHSKVLEQAPRKMNHQHKKLSCVGCFDLHVFFRNAAIFGFPFIHSVTPSMRCTFFFIQRRN